MINKLSKNLLEIYALPSTLPYEARTFLPLRVQAAIIQPTLGAKNNLF